MFTEHGASSLQASTKRIHSRHCRRDVDHVDGKSTALVERTRHGEIGSTGAASHRFAWTDPGRTSSSVVNTQWRQGHAEALHRPPDAFLTMKKFVLVPETKHRQALAASAASENRDVLQSIQHPEQREMLKRYHLAQNTLHDTQRSSDGGAKMDEYHEVMQDFSLLRDRGSGVRPPSRHKQTNGNETMTMVRR